MQCVHGLYYQCPLPVWKHEHIKLLTANTIMLLSISAKCCLPVYSLQRLLLAVIHVFIIIFRQPVLTKCFSGRNMWVTGCEPQPLMSKLCFVHPTIDPDLLSVTSVCKYVTLHGLEHAFSTNTIQAAIMRCNEEAQAAPTTNKRDPCRLSPWLLLLNGLIANERV